MELKSIKHQIANLRRHYGLNGDDILACYDTAMVALGNYTTIKYITVSINPINWKSISVKVDPGNIVKHPDTDVQCIKLFDNLYVLSQFRVRDTDVLWSSKLNVYTPTTSYLIFRMEKVLCASKSTKKQLEYANNLLGKLLRDWSISNESIMLNSDL